MKGLVVVVVAGLLAGPVLAAELGVAKPVPGGRDSTAWQPEVQLTNNSYEELLDFSGQRNVAIGPDGMVHVVWYSALPVQAIHYIRRNPLTQQWTADTIISSDISDTLLRNPVISVDSTGRVYVAWVGGIGSTAMIYLKSCVPTGLGNGGWSPTIAAATLPPPFDREYPGLATTPDGLAHLVWIERLDIDNWAIAYRSFASGLPLGPEQLLVPSPTAKQHPVLAGARNNSVHLAYAGFDEGSGLFQIFYLARSGGSWQPVPENVSQAAGPQGWPSINCNPLTNEPHVVWRGRPTTGTAERIIHKFRSGGGWSAADTVSEPGNPVGQGGCQLAMTPDGRGHVVWAGKLIGMANPQILFRERNPSGTWDDIVALTTLPAGSNPDLPSIAGSYASRTVVVWRDSRPGRDGGVELYCRDGRPTSFHDVGVQAIVTPVGLIDSGEVITPQVIVRNWGTFTESFAVRLTITGGYQQTQMVTMLQEGESRLVTFAPPWNALLVGPFEVRCSTMLADIDPRNDTAVARGDVRVSDAAATAILAPQGTILVGEPVFPQVRVSNYGTAPSPIPVRFVVYDSAWNQVYNVAELTGVVPVNGSVDHSFGTAWTPVVTGRYRLNAVTEATNDRDPSNDLISDSVLVMSIVTGWRWRSTVPAEPSGKAPKAGASFTYHVGNGLIYLVKGNNTSDFYSWNPRQDSWQSLESVPFGSSQRKVKKGGTACSDGNRYLYMVKGGNTREFFRFDVFTGHWQELEPVPLEPSNKAVKGGGGMVYAEGPDGPSIYFLKGYEDDFLRFDIDSMVWSVLPSPPPGRKPKWAEGSWVVCDGMSTIYAHKAKYSELWTFNIETRQWAPTALPGIPIESGGKKRKAKDGSSGFYLDGVIVALKGGNTNEFYVYNISTNQWRPLDSMPASRSGGKPWRVKAGGDITGYTGFDRPGVPVSLPAIKGGGCDDVWSYECKKEELTEGFDGCQAGSVSAGLWPGWYSAQTIGSGRKLQLPEGTGAWVFDVTGRCVATGYGTAAIDLGRVGSGVYLVLLQTAGRQSVQRLVVTR